MSSYFLASCRSSVSDCCILTVLGTVRQYASESWEQPGSKTPQSGRVHRTQTRSDNVHQGSAFLSDAQSRWTSSTSSTHFICWPYLQLVICLFCQKSKAEPHPVTPLSEKEMLVRKHKYWQRSWEPPPPKTAKVIFRKLSSKVTKWVHCFKHFPLDEFYCAVFLSCSFRFLKCANSAFFTQNWSIRVGFLTSMTMLRAEVWK